MEALKSRKAEVVEKEKIKHEKVEGSSSSSTEDKTVEPSPQGPKVDLTYELPLIPESRSVEDVALMKSLGISLEMDDFFSSTADFVNVRNDKEESTKDSFYRQEIWSWMDTSLSRGEFRWVVKQIKPYYDIRALYVKITSLANKATWISHALEFRKIFTIPSTGKDIFQYHAEIIAQIDFVKMQGASLGLATTIAPWMEQCLLLGAAWQIPHYKEVAMEFTLDDKALTVEALIKELEKKRLVTSHLNLSSQRPEKPREERGARVHLAATTPKYCYGFQKGNCKRGADCPFLHEKEPPRKDSKPQNAPPPQARLSREGKPPKPTTRGNDREHSRGRSRVRDQSKARRSVSVAPGRKCFRCGSSAHLAPECKFDGTCDHCKKSGHKASVCKKRQSETPSVNIAHANGDEVVLVRVARIFEHEEPYPPQSSWGLEDASVPDTDYSISWLFNTTSQP